MTSTIVITFFMGIVVYSVTSFFDNTFSPLIMLEAGLLAAFGGLMVCVFFPEEDDKQA